jgi:hypothetical protein
MTNIEWNEDALGKVVKDATEQAGSELQDAFDEVHSLFVRGGDEDGVRSALSSAMRRRGLNGEAAHDPEMNATVSALASGQHVGVRTTYIRTGRLQAVRGSETDGSNRMCKEVASLVLTS